MPLAERVRLRRREHHVGPPRPHVVERDLRVAVGRVGEHVVDAEGGEHRRSVGRRADRHPRPPPDRHEGPQRRAAAAAPGAGDGSERRAAPTASASVDERRADVGDRADGEQPCTATPAAASASASSRRFSSSHITTRSGASATIAVDVRVLRAADVRQVGLLAEAGARPPGAIPQASSVSVTDGTRLTTRLRAHIAEQLRLLGLVLGRVSTPCWTQLVELLELLGGRERRPRRRGRAARPGRTCGSRCPPSARRSRSARAPACGCR